MPLFFFPEMVRDHSAAVAQQSLHTRPPARLLVPQLLAKIKEAQWVLDLAHSAGGNNKSNLPDPNPGAGFKARRTHARVRDSKFVYPLDEPPPQSSFSVCT